MQLIFTIPIVSICEANKGGKLRDKWKRKRQQRECAYIYAMNEIRTKKINIDKLKLSRITCIRHGKRQLDDDNLASSFKHIIDGVASAFGVNDKNIRMFFEQTTKNKEPYTELKLELQ